MKTNFTKIAFSLLLTFSAAVGWGQTFYNMSSSNYSQDFSNISGWTNNYASGTGAANWRTATSVASSTLNTTGVFVTGTAGGVQKGTNTMILLATGTNRTGTDLLLDFTGRNAGTISLDWVKVVNTASATPRSSDIKIQYSTDNGSTFSDLTGYTIPRVLNNATAESGSLSAISLPSALNNQSQVVIRFYVWNNGQTGGSGNRPKIQIDNISVTSTAPSGCTAPTTQASAITFSSVTTNAMNVNWTNGNGAGRVVIMNTSNTFTAPTNGSNPTANTTYSGSGQQVVFNGTGSGPISILGLTAGTTYWYRVYEFCNPDRTYQTATSSNNPNSQQTVPNPTITRTPATLSGFTYVVGSGPSANQTFTVSAVGLTANLVLSAPTDYQISTSSGSGFGSSVTLTPTSGTVASTTIYVSLVSGLGLGTYNSQNIVCSSTGATSLNVTCSGSVTGSNNSDIIAVASSESTTISSLINNAAPLTSSTGVQVWQFRVRDGGASLNDADNLPTILTAFTLAQAAGNQVANWGSNIQSVALFDGSTFIATGTVTANQIQFTGLSESVADNTEKTFSLRLSLNCPLTASEGQDFQFSLSNANTTFSALGSGKASFSAQTSTNNLNAIAVVATELAFEQQPTNTGVLGTMTPAVTVRAVDACGNLDTDFAGVVSITSTGTLSSSPLTATAVAGIATFSNITHTVVGTGHTLSATASSLTGATSNTFNVLDVTILDGGDVVIVAINTAYLSSGGDDEICFFSFKDIIPGTSIELTDNGYERLSAGLWGDTEGTVRFTYNGSATISAGTTICIQGAGNTTGDFDVINCGSNNTSDWTITNLNGGSFTFNLNAADQVWILQNGTWNNPSGNHNAEYTGNFVWGWTATGWESAPGYASTAGSTLPEGTACLNTDVNGLTSPDKVKYTGPMTTATQNEWIIRINNSANWTGYSSNANYNAASQDYSGSCITFPITTGGYTAGLWTGATDNNWFNCANWQNLQVPDENTNVVISTSAANEAVIDQTAGFAGLYDFIAKTNNLNIEDGIWVELADNNDTLKVFGNLIIEDGALLDNTNGGVVSVIGNLSIESGALLDFSSIASGVNPRLLLGGNWDNQNTLNNGSFGFSENQSTLTLIGSATQTFSTAASADDFYNIVLNKTSGAKMVIADDIVITNVLTFTNGIIETGSNTLFVSNSSSTAIINGATAGTDNYVEGRLNWATNGASYIFPVGHTTHGAQGFNIDVTGSGNVLGFLETNSSTPIYANAYCDLETSPAAGTEVGDGNTGTDGVLDRVTFNLASPLQWNITNPLGGVTNFDLVVYANGGQDIAPVVSANGTPVRYLMKNGEPGNAGVTTSTGAPSFSTVGLLACPNQYALTRLTSFSLFTIDGATKSNTLLPVEMLYFTARGINNEYIKLEWATATEINNEGFEIEKSTDGVNFEKIGFIAGAGNYAGKLDYNSDDFEVQTGIVYYYRLKQIDFDGQFEYSKIVSASLKNGNNWINIYPVPANDNVVVESSETIISSKIFDVAGRKIIAETTNLSENKLSISINHLAKGVYYLKIQTALGKQTLKFIKE